MATPALVNLLEALYADLYGAVGARVLRFILLREGTTAVQVARETQLPMTAVQRTLVSLVTNRFVLFWQVAGHPTQYFGNPRQVYTLLWSGPFVAVVPEPLREAATDAIVSGLVPATPANEALINDGTLQSAAEWEFWPESELVQSLEQQSMRAVQSDPDTMGKSETAKRAQVLADSQRELQRIRSTGSNGQTFSHNSFLGGGGNGMLKTEASNTVSTTTTTKKTLYKVNWNKFLIASRREELAAFSARVVGATTAKVYEIVLRLSESSISEPRRLRVPTPESTVTTQKIVRELSPALIDELRAAFVTQEKEESSAKRVRTNAGGAAGVPNGPAGMKPAELVNKHLDLLVESKCAQFIQRVGSIEGGEWFVPFEKVVADLQRDTLDDIVARSLGEPAARLLRLIRSTGKLDEKMLGNHALLPSLEIRHQMSALSFYGFADIQELARPGDRNASLAASQKRSIFLWYHRPKWAYQRLQDLLYAQLLATLKQTQELREKHSILLAKLTREDVQNNMAELLTEREHKELADFSADERSLFKRMSMIDRHVRIFREY